MVSQVTVSILARPFERALRSRPPLNPFLLVFQSSPALSSGRYGLPHEGGRVGRCFNPRPPFRAGATSTLSGIASWNNRFQSSPALSSGRYHGLLTDGERDRVFQSSPALSSGRYRACWWIRFLAKEQFQSSPALSSGRYLWRSYRGPAPMRFQSSPALSSGRYRGANCLQEDARLVSILARPFERALQRSGHCGRRSDGFQSSPALSSGRYIDGTLSTAEADWFQSSPALSSGRY